MMAEELDQFLGTQRGELIDTHLIGAHHPTLREALDQADGAEVLVADHVRDNVFDSPPRAQAGSTPLLR
jgi:hypothetical protein